MKRILSIMFIGLLCFSMLSIFSPKVKATNNTLVEDNFESYTVGTFPSSGDWQLVWDGAGAQYQVVTDAVSYSPTKSLQLLGQNGWSANVQKTFSSNSSIISYGAEVMCENNTGSADNIASICLWNLSGLAWGKRFAGVYFQEDGYIYTDPIHVYSPVHIKLMPYQANTWYKVSVVINRTAGQYSVWINDQLVAENIAVQDTNQIEGIMLAAGWTGVKAYFDDISVSEGSSHALVGYWKFDEGSGSIAYDSSGNGNDGTANGATWTTGISNGALQFDGSDDYVGISSSPSLTLSGNEISLEMWIRPAVTLDTSLSSMVEPLDKANAYGFLMVPNDARMYLFVNIGGADQWLSSTTHDWVAGTWYHIAGTYDGTSEKIYINGVLENTTSLSGNLSGISGPLSIGSYCYGTQRFFNGTIDEVKIYNYARTAEDIMNDARAQSSPLSVSISPLSASIFVGQSAHFASTETGGVPPYTDRWYLNGTLVSGPGANLTDWTFTPTQKGTYYVWKGITDNSGTAVNSTHAQVTVASPPSVGGYSIPTTSAATLTCFLTLISFLTVGFVAIKRKTKRKTES